MQYRILGRLEASRDDVLVPLGGLQQRVLLVLLLLARGRTVPLDRLIDGLWAEEPPKAAVHTVRVYVSQLRKLLGEDELETRDRGYGLRLRPGALDADLFEQRLTEARRHGAGGDPAAAEPGLREALDLWRGPALVEFAASGLFVAEASRLEELRLGAEEDLIDIQLGQAASAVLIPRLEELRAGHPLRERVTAQLMTALYRAGRQADALEAYDRTRRALDEIGLQPGHELRQLQRQILQHDFGLARHAGGAAPAPEPTRTSRSRWRVVAGLGALAAAIAAAAVLALSSSGGAGAPATAATSKDPVTLVVGGNPPSRQKGPALVGDSITLDELAGLRTAAITDHVPTHVAYGDYFRALAEAGAHSRLVLLGPNPDYRHMAAVTRAHPNTVYVLLGGSVHDAAFGRHVLGMPFSNVEVGYLGGYLSALMAKGGHPSAVAGVATPEVQAIVRGYEAGVRAAVRGMRPVVTYSGNFDMPATCERIADRQINRGSTIVFDIAGGCGYGAVKAAGDLGVRAIGIDSDLSGEGPQVIGSVVKRFSAAVEQAVQLQINGQLHPGRDLSLNLGNGGVDVVGLNDVPASVRGRLEHVILRMTAHDQSVDNGGS